MSPLEKRRQGKETDLRPQDMPLSYTQQQVHTALAAAWQEAGTALSPWMGAPQAGVLGELQSAESLGEWEARSFRKNAPRNRNP